MPKISATFQSVALSKSNLKYVNNFKEKCTELEYMIRCLVITRARAVALTRLEELSMWLSKAVAQHQQELL